MTTTQITTHETDAKNRLLYQYQNAPKLKNLLDSYFGAQVQELENTLWNLFSRLDIDASVGEQLDKIGTIVGQPRNGITDDPQYRILLKAKIGQNVSESEAERVISVWEIMTQADVIHLLESFPAEINLMASEPLPADLVQLAFLLIQKVVGAGIRVGHIGYFDQTSVFKIEGGLLGHTGGFGDLLNPGNGGIYASLQDPNIPFAFKGGSTSRGFGDLLDPLVGGKYQSV